MGNDITNGMQRNLQDWLVVIPARLASQRLPKKPLQDLAGKPLIVRVRENLIPLERMGARIVIATDHQEIEAVCAKFGFESMMTLPSHASGTDRCQEVASQFKYPFILNVQGDEPFINKVDLLALIDGFTRTTLPMGTLFYRSTDLADYQSPNVVKIVATPMNTAIYFSRAAVPYDRDQRNGEIGAVDFLQHLGVYVFRHETLAAFCKMPPSVLEKREKLEQLRAVEAGWQIHLQEASRRSLGIDTKEDLDAAIAFIKG